MTIYNEEINYNDIDHTYLGGPPVIQEYGIRLLDDSLFPIGELPDYEDFAFGDSLNEETGWSFNYPTTGIDFDKLTADSGDIFFVANLPGGYSYYGYLEEDSWEEVDSQEKTASFSGRGIEGVLEYARVYPKGGVGKKPAKYPFLNKTPGYIFRTLIGEAQNRGAVPYIRMNFTDTHDSSGTPWENVISFEVPAGASILDVLKDFSARRWFDWRMEGTSLAVYNTDEGMAIDRKDVIFRRGIHIRKSPRQRSKKDIATSILLVGDDGVSVEEKNLSAIATRGRKEGFISQGGTNEPTLLQSIGEGRLRVSANPRLSKTQEISYTTIVPWRDFRAGDFVYTDIDGLLEKYRVVDLSYVVGQEPYGELVLNDRFDEIEIILQSRLDTIMNGAKGGSTPVTDSDLEDSGTPKAPVGLTANSDVYTTNTQTRAYILSSWFEVFENTDGSAFTDFSDYQFQYRVEDGIWNSRLTTDNQIYLDNLDVAVPVDIRVRARDKDGRNSAWSQILTIVTQRDEFPPQVPSAPMGTSRLGTITIAWDGKDYAGIDLTQTIDFSHIVVYVSEFQNQPLSDLNVVSRLRAASLTVVSDLPYDAIRYVKFTAVDSSGNESEPSEEVAISAKRVIGPDISPGSVTTNHVEAGSITVELLEATVLKAENLKAGYLEVDIGFVNGRLIAGVSGGNRVVFSQKGLEAYNAAGKRNVFINSQTGNATFIGEIGTNDPDEVGIFLYSTEFSHKGKQQSRPVIQFNVGASRDQPSIQADTGLRSGLMLYSGAQTNEKESTVQLHNGQIILGIESAVDSESFTGTRLDISNSYIDMYTDTGSVHSLHNSYYHVKTQNGAEIYAGDTTAFLTTPFGAFSSGERGKLEFNDFATYVGYEDDSGGLTGMQFNKGFNTRLLTPGPLEILNGGATSWRSVSASAFNTMSDRSMKTDIRPSNECGLDILRAAPIYKWRYAVEDSEDRLGPMAEDLPVILTNTITEEGHFAQGKTMLDMGQLVSILVKAVQELDVEMDQLRTETPPRMSPKF